MAFTQNTDPTFPKQPQLSRVQIAPADTTAQKTGYTAGANGSKIIGVIIASTDTSARVVTMSVTNAATAYPLSSKSITITAGTIDGTPPINMLSSAITPGLPLDNDGNPFLYLASGDTLTFNSATTVTAAKLITITVIAEDF